MDIIQNYFPNLDQKKLQALKKLEELYPEWNSKINVISRKDIGELNIRHILHSLAIAKYTNFSPGTSIIDVGTGGGFPGIPLAIFFPECKFHLVDSIGKKIKVVETIATKLNLQNVTAEQARSEKIKSKYDFVVSRAVTAFPRFVALTRHLISAQQKNPIANGILYLKGGEFTEEIEPFQKNITITELTDYFTEDFFETKKLIHLSL